MINVLIVDDHPIVRRGLRDILNDEPELSVTEAATGHDALDLIKTQPFDLAIVDLDLPGMSGLELLKEIKKANKRLHVLILSVYPEDQFAVRVLKAGAAGFVSKDAAPEQLVTAIKKILRGGRHVSEHVADLLLDQFSGNQAETLHERLSDREFQVLGLIGEGRTIKQIADELSLSSPTISTYRARILDKLDMKSTAEIVRYAIENQISRPK
jgi:two-component system, NarL family, invasion response regulator UvrY